MADHPPFTSRRRRQRVPPAQRLPGRQRPAVLVGGTQRAAAAARRPPRRHARALQPRKRSRSAGPTPRARARSASSRSTEDVSQYTKAAVFQPGATSRTLPRFSTVAGEMGSPDTWRDVRGFSLRFYTTEGNYDLVGNNTPIFFVRDPMKFPHFIRTQKRLPDSGLRDNTMQWDFWTLNPESAHQVTYLMGDRGLPRSVAPHERVRLAHLHVGQRRPASGSGSSTTSTPSRAWRHSPTRRRSTIAGADADFHRRDLFDAIERGDFPSWTLSVQVMPYEDAKDYRFNPFDLTKVWPHADYPLHRGRHADAEREPRELLRADRAGRVRAVEHSCPASGSRPDKMLLGRVFAYADAHRARIGTNFHQLPVNRPIVNGRATTTHRRHDDATSTAATRRVRAEQLRPQLRRLRGPGRRRLGGRRRDGPPGLHPARRGRRLGPGGRSSCATCSTTRHRDRFVATVSRRHSTGFATTSSGVPSSTGTRRRGDRPPDPPGRGAERAGGVASRADRRKVRCGAATMALRKEGACPTGRAPFRVRDPQCLIIAA